VTQGIANLMKNNVRESGERREIGKRINHT